MITRLVALIESAVEAVINAVVDRILDAWVEEPPAPLCGNPTKARDQ